MNDVESKIRRSEEVENPKDLATCNRLLLDQQRLEDQESLKNPQSSTNHVTLSHDLSKTVKSWKIEKQKSNRLKKKLMKICNRELTKFLTG